MLEQTRIEKIRAQAKQEGTTTLREAGMEKVMQGLTSIDEILAATLE